MLLSLSVAACEDKKEPAADPTPKPEPSAQPAKVPASAKAPVSASAVMPQTKPPVKLADGPGLGKVIALHDGYLYWTTQAGANCTTPGDCPSSSDGRIMRVQKDGGVPQEVAGGLDNVASLAFDDNNVLWSMCGLVDYVQRCRATIAPKTGGKRTLLFDAGPDLISSIVSAGDFAVWAEPGKKRLQKSDGKQPKPSVFTETGEVTDVLAQGSTVFWTEGRALAPEGMLKKVSAEGGPTTLATGRRLPRHLAADESHLYWVETEESEAGQSTQMILRVALDGGEPKPVVKNLPYIDGIAVAAKRVTFVTAEAVAWVPITGGKPVDLASAQKSPHGPAVDETHAYWIADDKVWRTEFQP
jgi:hypothetical protein